MSPDLEPLGRLAISDGRTPETFLDIGEVRGIIVPTGAEVFIRLRGRFAGADFHGEVWQLQAHQGNSVRIRVGSRVGMVHVMRVDAGDEDTFEVQARATEAGPWTA